MNTYLDYKLTGEVSEATLNIGFDEGNDVTFTIIAIDDKSNFDLEMETAAINQGDSAKVFITNAKEVSGNAIDGSEVVVTITSDQPDGIVFENTVDFSNTPGEAQITTAVLSTVATHKLTVSIDGVTEDATVNVEVEVHTYTIRLDAGHLVDFGSYIEGYDPAPKKTVQIERTGTGDIENLSVALSGTNEGDFTVTQPGVTTLTDVAPTTTFIVKPNTGITIGAITATVTGTANNNVEESFEVEFEVRAFEDATINPVTADYDLGTPADITTEITFNDAETLDEITGYGIGEEDWYLDESILVIKSDGFLDSFEAGDILALTLEFNEGADLTFEITVIDTTDYSGFALEMEKAAINQGDSAKVVITNAKDVSGNALDGSEVAVTITSDQPDGIVFDDLVNFSNPPGEAQIITNELNTVATHKLTVSIDGVTEDASVNVVVEALTYTISLDAGDLIDFGSYIEGYDPAPKEVVQIERTGTGDIENLSVALSAANEGDFTVTQPEVTTLDEETPITTFSVKPNTGITMGAITATVTVTANNYVEESFNVKLEVRAFEEATINPSTAEYDLGTPADITTEITFNDAETLDGISGYGIDVNDWYLDGNILVIKSDGFLEGFQDNDTVTLTLKFNEGADLTFDITVIDTNLPIVF